MTALLATWDRISHPITVLAVTKIVSHASAANKTTVLAVLRERA